MPQFPNLDLMPRLQKRLTAHLERSEVLMEVDTILKICLKQAESNVDALEQAMAQHKRSSKDAYEGVERNLELIKKDDEDAEALLQDMQRLQQDLSRFAREAKTDGDAYSNAFNNFGFRGDLPDAFIEQLKTLKTVDEYKTCSKATDLGKEIAKRVKPVAAAREKIIQRVAVVNAERDRIAEYGKRVETFIDTAAKLVQGEKAEKSKFITGATAFQQRLGRKGADIQNSLWRDYEALEARIQRNLTYLTSDNLEAVRKIWDTLKSEGEASRKNFSGGLKSLVIDLQALRAVHGKRFYAKLALPKLEKAVNDLANEFKMQQARLLDLDRKLVLRMQELGG